MTTQIEALKLALPIVERERFEQDASYGQNFNANRAEKARKAHEAIKEALAGAECDRQPEQKAVACVESYALKDLSDGRLSSHTFLWNVNRKPDSTSLVDLYTTPPQHALMAEHWKAEYDKLKEHVYDLVGELRVANIKLSMLPSRQWVGLTNEDILEALSSSYEQWEARELLDLDRKDYKLIEAKLKEKNA